MRVRAMTLEQVTLPTPPAAQGFDRVFEDHVSAVQRTLRRLGVREADVEDVCQEVFLVVHRRLPTFEGRSSFSTWLYSICIRAAAGYRRRSYRRHESSAAIPPEQSIPADQLDELVRRRSLALLDDILDQLDDDKRAIFVLHELEQVPMTQVAQASGCPLQTAYSRLYAARRHVESSVRRAEIARRSPRSAASLGAMFPWLLPSALPGALVGGGVAVALLLGVVWRSTPAPEIPAAMIAPAMVSAQPIAKGARPGPPIPPTRVDEDRESRAKESPRAVSAAPSAPLPSPADAEVKPNKDEELLLLQRAQGALSANPGEALAIADEHLSRFPGGGLSQERELFAISALVNLGRTAEARARAAQFFARFPSSAYRQRIEDLLAARGARD